MVSLVYLVYFVWLVELDKPDGPDQPPRFARPAVLLARQPYRGTLHVAAGSVKQTAFFMCGLSGLSSLFGSSGLSG